MSSLLSKFDAIDPQELAEFLVSRKRLLTADVKAYLAANFFIETPESPYRTQGMDLYQEVIDQLSAVKALRRTVITPGGVVEGSIRDTKEALTSVTSLLTTLVRLEEEVRNMDRQRAIEQATVEVLKDLGPEIHAKFLSLLEVKLRH